MLIRFGGGSGGFKDYLEHGQKQGREQTRNELDERIPLSGDLDVFETITKNMQTDGEKYLHVTLGFKENHIEEETLKQIVSDFRQFALAAYGDDEFHLYAEAHLPKIKSYVNKETGELVERYPHIHIGIPRENLLTGKRLAPFGYDKHAERFIDAFQEHINAKYGLSSPKDSPRISPTDAIDILARHGATEFLGQRHEDFKLDLAKNIVAGKINSLDELAAQAKKFGQIEIANEGKSGRQYVKIYMPGEDGGKSKAVRLRSQIFSEQFLARTPAERERIVREAAEIKYREAQQARKSPEAGEATLREWYSRRALELKHLHTDSKFYKEVYKPADEQKKLRILKKLEINFNEQHRRGLNVARFESTQRIPPPSRRNRLQQLPERDVVRGTGRSELLLPDNVPLDLDDAKAPRDSELRRSVVESGGRSVSTDADRADAGRESSRRGAGEADTGRDRTEPGRPGGGGLHESVRPEPQPGNLIDKSLAELADAYARAASKEQSAEIRKNIDAERLLAELARSHGINPALYRVAVGKDGTPRIVAGSRSLTPADFLQREMRLSWRESAPILRQIYEKQIGFERPKLPSREASPLWAEFADSWKARRAGLDDARKELVERGKAARADLTETLKKEATARRAAERAKLASPADRKAAAALAKLDAARRRAELTAKLAAEREALAMPKMSEAFATWLTDQANGGCVDALEELRRREARERKLSDDELTISPVQNSAIVAEKAAKFLENLQFTVLRNGDVEYRMDGKAALRDEGERLAVLDPQSSPAIAAALRLAREKFGSTLTLTGPADFQRQTVAVAVAEGLAVKFADPQLEALRQQLEAEKRAALAPRTAKPAREGKAEPSRLTESGAGAARSADLPAVGQKTAGRNDLVHFGKAGFAVVRPDGSFEVFKGIPGRGRKLSEGQAADKAEALEVARRQAVALGLLPPEPAPVMPEQEAPQIEPIPETFDGRSLTLADADADYSGPVLGQVAGHVVVEFNGFDQKAVAIPADSFGRDPVPGEIVIVKVREGRAVVSAPAPRTPGGLELG